MLGWWVAVATYVVAVVIVAAATYRPDDPVALAHFSQWTNIFFVWPALRAVDLGAFSEAIVFSLTLVVSTLHHGCLPDAALRQAVAIDTYALLGTALITLVGASAVLATRRRPAYRGFAAVAAIAGITLAGIVLYAVAPSAVGKGTLDGCLYPHEAGDPAYQPTVVPRLVDVWSTADFVTAFAALIVVFVYFFQTHPAVELGIFWLFTAIVLAGTLLEHAQLLGDGVFFATVLVVAVVMVTGRLLLWCFFDPRERVRAAVERYQCCDVIFGLLLTGVALAIFIGHNEPAFHGWWHVLAAAALFLVMESVMTFRFAANT